MRARLCARSHSHACARDCARDHIGRFGSDVAVTWPQNGDDKAKEPMIMKRMKKGTAIGEPQSEGSAAATLIIPSDVDHRVVHDGTPAIAGEALEEEPWQALEKVSKLRSTRPGRARAEPGTC